MDEQDLGEQNPERALDGLEEVELETETRFVQHLKACEHCRSELRRIVEECARRGVFRPDFGSSAVLPGLSQLNALQKRRRWRLAWARGLLAVAAVLLLLGLLFAVMQADRQVEELLARRASMTVTLAAADWSTPVLGVRAGEETALGRLYLDRAGRDGVLALTGLPMPGQGYVYQAWLLRRDGQVEGAGVFVPDSEGRVLLLVEAQVPWHQYLGMEITLEPGPQGSVQPTSQPVAGCKWEVTQE